MYWTYIPPLCSCRFIDTCKHSPTVNLYFIKLGYSSCWSILIATFMYKLVCVAVAAICFGSYITIKCVVYRIISYKARSIHTFFIGSKRMYLQTILDCVSDAFVELDLYL